MPLDPRLLEILCCPADEAGERCLGDLAEREDGLLCAKCGRLYPIEEGIPVMLVDRATRVKK
jgi:uncharacterized protein